MKISTVVVLGAGSAGLMAALTLKRKLPHLVVRVVRSPDIGIIAVGEGTTSVFPRHFFEHLGFRPLGRRPAFRPPPADRRTEWKIVYGRKIDR